jgi:hypothetical protein
MEEKAIQFIMEFYHVTRDVACEFYWDEIEAYMKLFGESPE